MGIHEWSYDNDISNDLRYRVPLRDKAVALKDVRLEVELGFDQKLGYREAERCLNCDVETVFTPRLCIECDACVDICPMDCITFTDERRGGRAARPAERAGAEPDPGPLRLGRAEDRPDHGEGRGCLPALRALRRALPDRRLGHAEIPPGHDLGRTSMSKPITSINDFVVKFANVNGSGSASANGCSPSRSCAWACRWRRATSSPRTSRACRPGTRCGSPRPAISAGAAAST